MMRSSAHLERCARWAAVKNSVSRTKSRSLTASMLFGQTPPIKPSSLAIFCLSTLKGLPASAPAHTIPCQLPMKKDYTYQRRLASRNTPDPKGKVATLGSRSRSRMSSLCQAAACERSQCPHRTVWAGCRWVNPGMMTSTSASARATAAFTRSAKAALTSFRAPNSQSLVSVATCRLQPLV